MEIERYFNDRLKYYTSIFSVYFDKHPFTNILVRYAEIGLKSDQTRIRMEKKLIEAIKLLLFKKNVNFTKFSVEPGRIYFSFKKEDVKLGSFIILNIPGVKSISPVLKTDISLKNIIRKCETYTKPFLKSKMSIGVKVKILKRSRYPNDNPKSISDRISERILLNLPESDRGDINIANPDLKIYLEIRDSFSYIYSKKIYAFNPGLPVESERASISNILGRFQDYDAFLRILRRGQNVLPVIFNTKLNKSFILKFFEFTEKIYPIERLYGISIDLERVLGILKGQLKQGKAAYICPLCRFYRFSVISYIISHQRAIFNKIIHDNDKIEETFNNIIFINPLIKKIHDPNEKRKIKFINLRGIIDGESDGIYCPISEDLWKTNTMIPDPLMQPEFILTQEQISQSYCDLLIADIIMKKLSKERQFFINRDEVGDFKNIGVKNSFNMSYFNEIKKNLIKKVCDYKIDIDEFDIDEFISIQKRTGITQLVNESVKNCQLIKIF